MTAAAWSAWVPQHALLASGVQLVLLPQPQWLRTLVHVAIPFGSCDGAVRCANQSLLIAPGAQHLLEHVLANRLEQMIGAQFAAHGVNLQAQTGWHRTGYHFWTLDAPLELTSALLQALLAVDIPADTVAHEQQIVAHELRQRQHDPRIQARQQMLQALFHQHPVRNSVIGTPAQIEALDSAHLLALYRTLYQPQTLTVFAAGPLDPNAWAAALSALPLPASAQPRPVRVEPVEPATVVTQRAQSTASVAVPMLRLAFKERDFTLPYALREQSSLLALELLTGPAGALARAGRAIQGSYDYAGDLSFGYSVLEWHTPQPEQLLELVASALADLRQQPIDPAQLALVQRNRCAQMLRALEQPDQAMLWLLTTHFKQTSLSDYLAAAQASSAELLQQRLSEHFQPLNAVASLVLPR